MDVPLLVSGLGNERGGMEVTNVDPPLVIVTGTDGSGLVVGAGTLFVDVALLVSGLGKESGGREVTTIDPPLVTVTGIDGRCVVIGAGPLLEELP